MPKKILCESGRDWNENAGDEAYVAAMVEQFRAKWPDVEITCFSPTPEKDATRYQVRAVFSGGSLLGTFCALPQMLRAILECDVYVWGAGQILRDDSGLKSPLYRLSRPFLAVILGKPVMAYAVGIGPLCGKWLRRLAGLVLSRFRMISVRDNTSLALLSELGVSKPRIELTVDPAFALSACRDDNYRQFLSSLNISPKEERLVGVAPFGPIYSRPDRVVPASKESLGQDSADSENRRSKNHSRIMAEVCDELICRYNVRLLFFCQDNSSQGLDGELSQMIIKEMKYPERALIVDSYAYHPCLVKALIGDLQCILGGRMHPLILASGECTPVLGLYFEKKLMSFGEVIGEDEYFLDAHKLESSVEVLAVFEDLWQKRAQIRARLATCRDRLLRSSEMNLKLLGDLLER